jgi:radical SAM protein with 4Fe4S-binding SPASM domain
MKNPIYSYIQKRTRIFGVTNSRLNTNKYLSAPIKVSYDVTYRCNLSCQHCRISDDHKKDDELSFTEIQSLIDELSAMQVFIFGISGGEPFTRSDLTDIITYSANSKIPRIFLSTNCTLLNDGVLTKLKIYKNKLVIKVSIDGISDTHDKIRGVIGAFDRAVESIKLALKLGFQVNVTTTLTKSNFNEIIDIIDSIKKLGAQKHRIISVMPLGRANNDLLLSDMDQAWVWSTFKNNKDNLINSNFSVTLDIPFMKQSYTEFTCRAGISECGIMPDGTVLGCRLMPELSSGNVKYRNFKEIWEDAESFKPFRSFTSDDIKGKCFNCEYKESCKGGCRAYAMSVYDDFYMPDPRCQLV